MSTTLLFGRDAGGYNAFASPFSTNKFSATLTTDTEETITVPSNFKNWIVRFSYEDDTNVWVALNATASDPAGATFAATNSELNPDIRTVLSGDVIHLVTSSTSAEVGVILYPIP